MMLKTRVRRLEQTHRGGTDIERELRVLTDEELEALIAAGRVTVGARARLDPRRIARLLPGG